MFRDQHSESIVRFQRPEYSLQSTAFRVQRPESRVHGPCVQNSGIPVCYLKISHTRNIESKQKKYLRQLEVFTSVFLTRIVYFKNMFLINSLTVVKIQIFTYNLSYFSEQLLLVIYGLEPHSYNLKSDGDTLAE